MLQHTPVLWAASAIGQIDIAVSCGATLCIADTMDQVLKSEGFFLEIPWRNNENMKNIINFHLTFGLFQLHIAIIFYHPQVPIQKKVNSSLKSWVHHQPTFQQPSNHQLPGVHPSTSSNDLGLCTEFLGGVATLRGAKDSLDFHLGWRDACSLGSTLAEWRWSALGRIID